jgi:hypothetical protein
MVASRQELNAPRDASAGAPPRRTRRNHDQAPRAKDPDASRTLKATAYHEAGHVVASHLERLPLRPVTIPPDGEVAGSCAHANILGGRHIDLVSFFTRGPAELDTYLKLLALRTDGLLNRPFVWDQVTAIAEALLAEKTIGSRRLERIIQTAREDAVQKLLGERRSAR